MSETQLTKDLATAKELYKEGKVNESLKKYKEIMVNFPNDPIAPHWVSIILEEQKKFREAIKYAEEAIKRDPEWVEARYGLAILNFEIGNLAEARLQIEAVKKYDQFDSFVGRIKDLIELIIDVAFDQIVGREKKFSSGIISGLGMSQIRDCVTAIIGDRCKTCDMVIMGDGSYRYSLIGEKNNYWAGILDSNLFYIMINDPEDRGWEDLLFMREIRLEKEEEEQREEKKEKIPDSY